MLTLLIPAASLGSFALAGTAGARGPIVPAMITLMICLAGGALVLRGLAPGRYPHARLGLCNVITLSRAAGIAVMAGLIAAPGALSGPEALGWALVALSALVLTLDLADGWAARRSGLNSTFGARFDVESDVAFAVVLAVLAWQADKAGVWFLTLGALRPAFLMSSLIWPWLSGALPDAMWRKTVAAVQMIAQVVLLAPVVTPPASEVLAALLLAGVALSFAVDIRALHARRDVVHGV
ncbi:CDP-alcohol phosphatidyltransferase family protein [Roseicitreum antarcticum]|uniref:CDP-alcohol phosphatidyltransferase family protein n=1 Tax=Roseicitreum antarcticum TaxID=564137 RepID=UPI0015A1BC90|nr:CDP-alcohol phosphatidyltransferase family protein [Roseicitreum antarcticum]